MLAVGSVGLAVNSRAQVSNFAVFGKNGVSLGQSSKVGLGLTGSNGSVSVKTFSVFRGGLAGGGDLNSPTNTAGSIVSGSPIRAFQSVTFDAW